jgi:hypothetical protein
MTDKKPLLTRRPTNNERAGEAQARAVLADAPKDERVYFTGPARYAMGLTELKNLSTNNTAVKLLLMEAIEDLFEKYSRGDGQYPVRDVAELKRRLDGLPK